MNHTTEWFSGERNKLRVFSDFYNKVYTKSVPDIFLDGKRSFKNINKWNVNKSCLAGSQISILSYPLWFVPFLLTTFPQLGECKKVLTRYLLHRHKTRQVFDNTREIWRGRAEGECSQVAVLFDDSITNIVKELVIVHRGKAQ